jgi:aldehyde dehydrogenase (NAD+)
MEKEEIKQVFDNQCRFFASGRTRDISYRISVLKELRSLILRYEQEIIDALWKDFHKPEFEVISTETRFVVKEINHIIRRLRWWARKRYVRTPITHFLSNSYVLPQPHGQVLIFSPWNFPLQLAFMPLVGAIAAGNCVMLKMSRQVPETGKVMEKILSCLPKELVVMIDGDHAISELLLNLKFDFIFFTGSREVGKYVMQKAADNLTPLALELGGKNPCVVAADARLDFAARRIAWGKLINSGQTCVCPDYVLIDKKIKDQFVKMIQNEINIFYDNKPEASNSFARIINSENVIRLSELTKESRIVAGGIFNPDKKYVSPTIITDVRPDDPIMKEEIFGPVLPIIEFNEIDEAYSIIENNPKSLSAYIFTTSRILANEFMAKTQSGNAGINETVMQIASPYLPYGGVGWSGLGRYHGKSSFDTFSNLRSVVVKSNLLDIPLRYPPYTDLKKKFIKLVMR